METIEFADVEVLDESVAALLCRIAARRVAVPSLLLQPGTTVRQPGDHGTLVIPRWLGIGLGLVWPFPKTAAGPGGGGPRASEGRARRPPRRAATPRAAKQVTERRGGS
jgi:hypothetical protein